MINLYNYIFFILEHMINTIISNSYNYEVLGSNQNNMLDLNPKQNV